MSRPCGHSQLRVAYRTKTYVKKQDALCVFLFIKYGILIAYTMINQNKKHPIKGVFYLKMFHAIQVAKNQLNVFLYLEQESDFTLASQILTLDIFQLSLK